jgi:hypothetical protein
MPATEGLEPMMASMLGVLAGMAGSWQRFRGQSGRGAAAREDHGDQGQSRTHLLASKAMVAPRQGSPRSRRVVLQILSAVSSAGIRFETHRRQLVWISARPLPKLRRPPWSIRRAEDGHHRGQRGWPRSGRD